MVINLASASPSHNPTAFCAPSSGVKLYNTAGGQAAQLHEKQGRYVTLAS